MIKKYFVYILLCKDRTLYTGIATNVKRRFKEHQQGRGGHYTVSRGVKRVLYSEVHKNRSLASKREFEIKSWPRSQKLLFIKTQN